MRLVPFNKRLIGPVGTSQSASDCEYYNENVFLKVASEVRNEIVPAMRAYF